ncbi:hydroxypyruvate reductase [Megalopta genalis]|uniref:hydroxypyruvate reductase n=1 Tax=Megalopta genalis TaxID=115081 RepID=UPI00144388BA|nr:hydroxypyruvate reductase [Megalopta genalis]XP_033327573.1 hydroxypyruvate reductase [Megalopta genalis]XP_033327574.1 hydroxypyruvate reductase [Megalopta genalis]
MSARIGSVLISDAVDACCGELLARHGVPVTAKSKLSKEELIKELQNHDALIVRSETKVTSDVFESCPKLRVVGRAGTGVDNIDLQAATKHGVVVLNTPGGNSISACELTCALISALARNVAQAAGALKEGRWDRKLYSGSELSGKTLAVLGMGRIGREVARRMQAFGMRVIAFDPVLTVEDAAQLQVEKLSLDEIWPQADYITVHTPLIPQTRNLINAATLAKCKKGVRVVNVARGGIIDEEALLESIEAGHCGGAALDVFVEEPPKNPVTLKLIAHPKVVATPHLGASTTEAQERVAVEIAEQFIVLAGKSTEYAVTGIVNAPMMSGAMMKENAPWIDLSKKLGQLAARLSKDKDKLVLKSETVGNGMKEKAFIHTAILVGVLSTQTKNGLNLINAPMLAQDKGVDVKAGHREAGTQAISIDIAGHTLKGTVRNNELLLLSLDDAMFPGGISLANYVALYQTNRVEDMAQIVNEFSSKGINIHSLNASGNWIVVQADEEVSLKVDGIKNF